MTEPYDPIAEARLFHNSNPPGARLSATELLPTTRTTRQNSSTVSRDEQDGAQSEPKQPSAQMSKIKQTQEELELVKDHLASNIVAIQERGESLNNLQDKTDKLSIQSQSFRSQATAIRRQMWWKNLKWTICIGVFVIIIIAGAVGGGVKGRQIIEDHRTVTETQPAGPTSVTPVR